MGALIPRTTLVSVSANFCAAKKSRKKGNPVNHNFTQLTKKIKKLEKALKKSGKKVQKSRHEDSDSDSK
jgi:hypothetical protein